MTTLISLGTVYDLSHLAPRALTCPRPGRPGTTGRDLVIRVAFSHHCYTTGIADSEPGACVVVERDDTRAFNVARWELSRQYLLGMLMALPQAKVEHTPEVRNYRYALKGELADGSLYQMFFSLRRSLDQGFDLRLFVESAYPIRSGDRPRSPGTIRFQVLAMKVLAGEQVRHPPRR